MPPPFPAGDNAGDQGPQELPLRGPGPNAGAFGGPAPQLPPQMFTTAAQLLDLTDKKLLLVLRDGRKLVGVLRTWDQFANIVLQDTVERYFAGDMYADVKRGIFLVRGENVLLLGEIDLDRDDEPPQGYREADPGVVHAAWKEEQAARRNKDRSKGKALGREGFEAEHSGEALLW